MGQYLCKYFRKEKRVIILRNNYATAIIIFRYTHCQKLNIIFGEEQKILFVWVKILQCFPAKDISKVSYLAKVFHLLTFLEALLWFFQALSHTEYSMFPLYTSEETTKAFFFPLTLCFIHNHWKEKIETMVRVSLDLFLLENWIRSVNGFWYR